MSLRSKVILIAVFGVLFNAIFIYYFSATISKKEMVKIENEQTIRNNNNFKTVFENSTLENLATKLSDWASWDDTYKFIEDKNEDYIKSNLQNQSLINLKLNFMVYINNDDEIVFSKGYDLGKNQEIELGSDFKKALKSDSLLLKHENLESSVKGIIQTERGALILVSKPILTSEAKGPSRGTLIFARFFDSEIVDNISTLIDLPVSIISTNEKDINSDFAKAKNYFTSKNDTFISTVSDKKLNSYGMIRDIYGEQVIIYQIEHNRDIYIKATTASRNFPLFVLVSGLFVSVLAVFILDRQVFFRITVMQNKLRNLGESGDISYRFPLKHNDEISHLASGINFLMDSIVKLQDKTGIVMNQLKLKDNTLETQNKTLVDTKKAILNVLEDSKALGEQLKIQKENVEKIVIEKTKELSQEKDRLFKFLETIPEGVFVLDASGKPLYANSEFKRLIGTTTTTTTTTTTMSKDFQMYIANSDKLYPPEKIPVVEALSGQIKSVRDIEIKKGNLIIPLEVSGAPILGTDGKIAYSIATFKDITEEKIVERSKDEFFSIASHELRTPLTSIRGNTSMIIDYFGETLKDPQVKEMIADIHESSIRLIQIVNDFLNVSRLEQGRMVFANENLDLVQLTKDVLLEINYLAKDKNLYLKLDENNLANLPHAYADKTRIKEVVTNLVGNAVKFTEKGGITVKITQKDSFLYIHVVDTGRGIAPQQQNLLFRKFQQAGESLLTRDTTKGTGLGLYISKLMVEGVGGQIFLESSAENQGSTFTFTLPVYTSQKITATTQVPSPTATNVAINPATPAKIVDSTILTPTIAKNPPKPNMQPHKPQDTKETIKTKAVKK